VAVLAGEVDRLLGALAAAAVNRTARVDEDKCVSCLTCLRLCPHGAIDYDATAEAATIAPTACQRCGICAAECPAEAIELPGWSQAESAAAADPPGRVTVLACANSAAEAARRLAAEGRTYAPDIRLVETPCAGQVDPQTVLAALQAGAERVVVLGCHDEACKFFDGPARARRRMDRLKRMLASAGADPERVAWGSMTAGETDCLADWMVGRAATPETATEGQTP
jgi:coenzyme F420-reducing hydrogenase delta subunit/Pyruvate/2-oxoacid:ferredoxin oxidoreductase delta subunit